jgi:hypothetical protein
VPRRREAATKRIAKLPAERDHMTARSRVGPKRAADGRGIRAKGKKAILVGDKVQAPAPGPLPHPNQVRAPCKFAADDWANAHAELGKID